MLFRCGEWTKLGIFSFVIVFFRPFFFLHTVLMFCSVWFDLICLYWFSFVEFSFELSLDQFVVYVSSV